MTRTLFTQKDRGTRGEAESLDEDPDPKHLEPAVTANRREILVLNGPANANEKNPVVFSSVTVVI